jgi:hypothetical protein
LFIDHLFRFISGSSFYFLSIKIPSGFPEAALLFFLPSRLRALPDSSVDEQRSATRLIVVGAFLVSTVNLWDHRPLGPLCLCRRQYPSFTSVPSERTIEIC